MQRNRMVNRSNFYRFRINGKVYTALIGILRPNTILRIISNVVGHGHLFDLDRHRTRRIRMHGINFAVDEETGWHTIGTIIDKIDGRVLTNDLAKGHAGRLNGHIGLSIQRNIPAVPTTKVISKIVLNNKCLSAVGLGEMTKISSKRRARCHRANGRNCHSCSLARLHWRSYFIDNHQGSANLIENNFECRIHYSYLKTVKRLKSGLKKAFKESFED